jgi:hypothetical protein
LRELRLGGFESFGGQCITASRWDLKSSGGPISRYGHSMAYYTLDRRERGALRYRTPCGAVPGPEIVIVDAAGEPAEHQHAVVLARRALEAKEAKAA